VHKLESARAGGRAAVPRYAPNPGRIKIRVPRRDSTARGVSHKNDVNTHCRDAPKAGMPTTLRIVPGNF